MFLWIVLCLGADIETVFLLWPSKSTQVQKLTFTHKVAIQVLVFQQHSIRSMNRLVFKNFSTTDRGTGDGKQANA